MAWIADSKERKRAMIISAVSMLLILFIVSVQDFSPPSERTEAETSAQENTYSVPPKPQDEPAAAVQPEKPESAAPAKPEPITPLTPAKQVQNIQQNVQQVGYYVQVGAFRGHKLAKSLQNRLQKAGWDVVLNEKKSGIQAVWVGPWKTKEQADAAMGKLQSQEKLKGFIVRKK